MSCTKPNYLHLSSLYLALFFVAYFTSLQVAARHLLQTNELPNLSPQLASPVVTLPVEASPVVALPVEASPVVASPVVTLPVEASPVVEPLNFKKIPRTSMTYPAFHKPLLPPHFLPILPFPSMPNMPSFPTFPSQPTPTGPSNPSYPNGPNNGVPSNVPPSASSPPAKLSIDNPSSIPSVKSP